MPGAQFKKGLAESGLTLSEAHLQALFRTFDADCSGFLDFDEFAEGVRPEMSERRKKLVQEAFQVRTRAILRPGLRSCIPVYHCV